MKTILNPIPKTLDEAILKSIYICPLDQIPDHSYKVISEFIAEKFTKAMLSAKDIETEEMLHRLYQDITERPNFKSLFKDIQAQTGSILEDSRDFLKRD